MSGLVDARVNGAAEVLDERSVKAGSTAFSISPVKMRRVVMENDGRR
jgi:hypothetical protein